MFINLTINIKNTGDNTTATRKSPRSMIDTYKYTIIFIEYT